MSDRIAVANDDLTDRYAARITAYEKGWSEEAGRDFCPSHTRSRQLRAQIRAAAAMAYDVPVAMLGIQP